VPACLLQLEVLFLEHRFARRVLRRVRVERVLWAWAGDVPVVELDRPRQICGHWAF
jgi:hypothetical protein